MIKIFKDTMQENSASPNFNLAPQQGTEWYNQDSAGADHCGAKGV